MSDKMLRIAGRGEDGKAKAIKTNNDGTVQTHDLMSKKEIEELKLKQEEDNQTIISKLTALETKLNGTINTQLTGSIVEETIVDAETIGAGESTGMVDLNIDNNEKQTFILVNIDKSPWTMYGEIPWRGGYHSRVFFPARSNEEETYSSTLRPATSRVMHMLPSSDLGLSEIDSQSDAILFTPPQEGTKAQVINNSDETATVAIRVLHIRR